MITDTEYVLADLRAHPKGRDAMQIVMASIRDRDIGLTCHSRVADLRDQGYGITCAVEGQTRKGRPRWVYRLVSEPEVAGVVEPPPASVEQEPRHVSNTTGVALPDAELPGQLSLIA